MKILYIILIVFLAGSSAQAQTDQPCSTCLPEGITFTTQAQIDSFQFNYPECTEIVGDVTISGDDIFNLNGLSALTSIGGDLEISYNDSLTSLTGLEGITSIGNYLYISDNNSLSNLTGLDGLISVSTLRIVKNDALSSLTGLDNLTSIGGSIFIGYDGGNGNPALTSLTGLEGITSIGGVLFIDDNDALISLTGLDNLTSIGSILNIWGNNALTNLTGLDNLNSIGSGLGILSNDALTSLTGLDNLTSIGFDLYIGENGSLISLSGLEGLTSIVGILGIYTNNSLTSLTGVDNIEAGSITALLIYSNPLLSTCEVQSVCDYLASPNGTIQINNNATGCDSREEVEQACGITGIGESSANSLQSSVSIYPNPSSNTISLELPNTSTPEKNTYLILSNTNGQQHINQLITKSKAEIDISYLPAGIYIVKVWNDKDVMVQKVVKQ